MDSVSLALLSSVSDFQDNFIVIFKDRDVMFTNKSFNDFFNVKTTDEYNASFGEFVNNFVPHPSYFHKDMITNSKDWTEEIALLDEDRRVVSMLSQTYEPHAFSVMVDNKLDGYSVVVFEDITQDLIKRIMTQNHTNIDKRSGAYTKKYFQQISKSYQEAAEFNEKIVAIITINIEADDISHKQFIEDLIVMIRHDDMLVRWDESKFLLVYMAESTDVSQKVLQKLERIIQQESMQGYRCSLKLTIQNEGEDVKTLIKKV